MPRYCQCGEELIEVEGIEMCKNNYCTRYREIKDEAPSDSIAYHREVMYRMKDTAKRVRYLLEQDPKAREMDDWDFLLYYWKYLLGLQWGHKWGPMWEKRIRTYCLPETVRRCHQLVCEPELKALRTIIKERGNPKPDTPDFYNLRNEVFNYLKTTKYIPTDFDLIKKKLEKETAMFELVITEGVPVA